MRKLIKNLKILLLVSRNLFLSFIRYTIKPAWAFEKLVQLILIVYLIKVGLLSVLIILVIMWLLSGAFRFWRLIHADNFELVQMLPINHGFRILIICQYLNLINY